MKWLIVVLPVMMIGCNGIKRLTGGQDAPPQEPLVIRGGQLGEAPEFNIPTPPNTTRQVLHNFLPADLIVRGLEASRIDVFIKDEVSGGWFVISGTEMHPYYYTYDSTAKTVTFRGSNLTTQKEYCIYVYLPA